MKAMIGTISDVGLLDKDSWLSLVKFLKLHSLAMWECDNYVAVENGGVIFIRGRQDYNRSEELVGHAYTYKIPTDYFLSVLEGGAKSIQSRELTTSFGAIRGSYGEVVYKEVCKAMKEQEKEGAA